MERTKETTTDWTDVSVQPLSGGGFLLEGGTGSGTMTQFACSPFDPDNLPVVGQQYLISATPDGAIDPIEWDATCSFAGTTSQFDAG